MTLLREGSLEFDFSAAIKAYKFDDPKIHGMNAMKQVDFIVEWEEEIWMLEIKDPEDVAIPPQRRASIRRKHRRNLQLRNMSATDAHLKSLAIYDEKLLVAYGEKCRDSFLYLYLQNQMQHKPLKFIVLIGMEILNTRVLTTATKWLRQSSALEGPAKKGWARPYLHSVQVVNLLEWRDRYPQVPIRRIPPILPNL